MLWCIPYFPNRPHHPQPNWVHSRPSFAATFDLILDCIVSGIIVAERAACCQVLA